MLLRCDWDFRPEVIARAATLRDLVMNEYTGKELQRAQKKSVEEKYRIGSYFKFYDRGYALYYHFQKEIEECWAARSAVRRCADPADWPIKTVYAIHQAEAAVYQRYHKFISTEPRARLSVAW